MLSLIRSSIEWNHSTLSLKYQFGDITLFEKHFSGVSCSTHFLRLSDDLVHNISVSLLNEHSVDAAQILSCPLKEDIKTVRFGHGVIMYCTSRYNHHYIATDCSFEEYQKKFKSKTRATLKKKVTKFFQEDPKGNYFKIFKTESEIETFIRLAGTVSSKTYQHHLFGRGIPQCQDFVEEARTQASKGLVRGYLLYFHNTPVSYTFGPVMGDGVFLFDYNGYDPDYSKLSPGNVLQFKIIEDLCSDPDIRVYDLCIGENEHKMLFSSASRFCADILVLRKSPRNVLLVLSSVAVCMASKVMGNILEHLKLKRWLRRLIRRNVGRVPKYDGQDNIGYPDESDECQGGFKR